MFLQWLVAITLACSILLPFQPVRFTTRPREVLCKDAMKLAPDPQWIIVTILVCSSFLPSEQVEYNAENLGVYFYDLRNPLPPEKQLFERLPCSCADLTCGCCAGLRVRAYNFSRKACTNLTYDPYEFSVTMNMLINDNSIYSNSVSGVRNSLHYGATLSCKQHQSAFRTLGEHESQQWRMFEAEAKNPPALCMPIIIPYLPTTFHLCMRLFNIFTPGTNLHACMDWEARVANKPVLILHFDCMRIGYDGVALVKPEDNGGLDLVTPSTSPSGEDDVYDEVTEDK